jgi:hypothetical protein
LTKRVLRWVLEHTRAGRAVLWVEWSKGYAAGQAFYPVARDIAEHKSVTLDEATSRLAESLGRRSR